MKNIAVRMVIHKILPLSQVQMPDNLYRHASIS
jgi:hypothetical protein